MPAHPQLRSLVDEAKEPVSAISCEALSLPWLAPTRPWWKLGGRWGELQQAGRLQGKALVFSRYKGTPAALSTRLSNEVDRRSSQQQKKGKFTSQAYLRPDAKAPLPLIALFMPFPTLCQAFEPVRGRDLTLRDVRTKARRDLRVWLAENGIALSEPKGAPRKVWRIAFDLEGRIGRPGLVTHALQPLKRLVNPKGWIRHDAPASITRREVELLADWLLEAPGPVVARTLRRHDPRVLTDPGAHGALFLFCWRQLRQYLSQRYFAGTIIGIRHRKRGLAYPEALRRAIVQGGLEATLDEHVAVMKLIGDASVLEMLEQSLVGRPGLVQHRTSSRLRRARVHAAAPYLGADRRNAPRGKEKGGLQDRTEKLRSSTLRNGFNSPFWPHVLATTSVGQEGLDFHVWCDRVIHWDLPRDPVDFEQREGRIARYASLGVRRALADAHAAETSDPWTSPFESIFTAAREVRSEGLGLERWWAPTGHRPVSVTFSLPFSTASLRLKRLREDLVRYRLALGQPEPQLFESMIEHFGLNHDEARTLALNLCPAA